MFLPICDNDYITISVINIIIITIIIVIIIIVENTHS